MKIRKVDPKDIRIGRRCRKELGDIQSLARSIEDVGILHPPLVRVDLQLLTGHRRLMAMKLLKWKQVPVVVVGGFKDAVMKIRAERDENVCRVDLLPSEIHSIIETLAPLEEKAAEEREKAGKSADGQYGGRGKKKPSGNLPQGLSSKSRDRIGEAVGLSGKSVDKLRDVMSSGQTDLIQMADEKSIDAAHRELKDRKLRKKQPKLPKGKFRVIYADPPWEYASGSAAMDYYGPAGRHYPLMSIDKLCALDIKSIAANDAVLFLWVTSPMLEVSFKVIHAWGFNYKSSFVWDKVQHNYGHYNSVRHEFLLICTRGSCTPDKRKLHDSVQAIERSGKHSEKPEAFRKIIDEIYHRGPRIELFARQEVKGWKRYGNE